MPTCGFSRLLFCALFCTGTALDNGQAKTPPMGFNPWNVFGKMNTGAPRNPGGIAGFNQSLLEATVDAMVARGLRDVGYVYMNLDCGWTDGHRDETGLRPNKTAFPNFTGMIEKIHSVGMKFG
jgi:alpha-galactosidase